MPNVYIIVRQRGGIKVGYSANPAKRLSELQISTPDRLELAWHADFGDRAVDIEAGAKKLLKPWHIRGEWFDTEPLVAGLAIEGARDQNARIDAFLGRLAACRGLGVLAEMAADEDLERDFPDFYPRTAPLDPGTWTDWTGKTHRLPHKKFTRVIVGGCPETTYGCPIPRHLRASVREG